MGEAMLYQQINRDTLSLSGPPSDLPYAVANWSDMDLRNLDGIDPSFGLKGSAYWPVVATDPTFDADKEALTDEIVDPQPDPVNFVVYGTRGKRPLTPEEVAARNPVTETISDRQFAQALAKQGVISQDEALAFVKRGEVPAMLQATIDAVEDPDERFDLDMAVSGATLFDRSNPSTIALAEALEWSPAQMDDLWRFAATIR